jgi:hypothetical protein
MTPHRTILARMCLACLALVTACTETDRAPDFAAESRASVGDAQLAVAVDRADITTVDRVIVSVDLTLPDGTTADFTPPLEDRFSAAGWSVIEITTAPPIALGENLRRSRTRATLEPFLPGQAAIPPITADLSGPGAATEITSEPIPVSVASLLDQDDPLAASPELVEARDPPPAPAATTDRIAIVAAAIGVPTILVALLVLIADRRPREHAEPSLRDLARRVRRIANRDAPDATELEAVDRALRAAQRIAHRETGGPPHEMTPVLTDLEIARFNPHAPSPAAARQLAERALSAIEQVLRAQQERAA